MKPLHDARHVHKKQHRLTRLDMTKEQREAYGKIQQAITHSATMYFVDEHVPITLETYASDYGIGTYLTQTVDGVDPSIAIISKSLDSTMVDS